MTSQDLALIEFLGSTGLVITAEQAARWYYKTKTPKGSINKARRRLLYLTTKKMPELKRAQIYRGPYVYYHKKNPTNLVHALMATEFLSRLSAVYEPLSINKEFQGLLKGYNTRPDLYVVVQGRSERLGILVECENSKTFNKKEEYKQIIGARKNNQLKDILPYRTLIVVVDKKDPEINGISWIDKDYKNFDKWLKYIVGKYGVEGD